MYHMILLVLNKLEQCPSVLDAWEAAGAPGITILESTGLARMKSGIRDDLPLMPSITSLLKGREEHHRTMFTIVKEEETVDRLFEATETVLGDLRQPNLGILFAVPVARAYGVLNREEAADEKS